MIIVVTLMNFFIVNPIQGGEITINKAKLYSKGECKSLLINTMTGGTIVVEKVFYKNGGKEYPAYCLNSDLKGVDGNDDYTVKISKLVDNQLVRRAVINGYPYKSLSSLGVNNVDEAFTATNKAVFLLLMWIKLNKSDFFNFSVIKIDFVDYSNPKSFFIFFI